MQNTPIVHRAAHCILFFRRCLEMMGRESKIQMLEKDVETVRVEVKTSQENQV